MDPAIPQLVKVSLHCGLQFQYSFTSCGSMAKLHFPGAWQDWHAALHSRHCLTCLGIVLGVVTGAARYPFHFTLDRCRQDTHVLGFSACLVSCCQHGCKAMQCKGNGCGSCLPGGSQMQCTICIS